MSRFAVALIVLVWNPITFAQSLFSTRSYAVPGEQYFITYDMNRDGFADVILFGGPLRVMLNDRHGSFGPPSLGPNVNAEFVAVADFDGDGLPDIAGCANNNINYGAVVSVFLNKGGGSFQQSFSSTLTEQCSGLVAADINGDGRADLVVPSRPPQIFQGTLRTFFGSGSGSFGSPIVQTVFLPAQKDYVDIGDCALGAAVGSAFTVAGRTDLILFGECNGNFGGGTTFYATSANNGTFALAEMSEDQIVTCSGGHPYVTDANGDGKEDVIVRCRDGGLLPHGESESVVSVLLNQGGAKFTGGGMAGYYCDWSPYCTAMEAGAMGDLNNDHYPESFLGYVYTPDGSSPSLARMLIADGKLPQSQSWQIAAMPTQVLVKDLNNDGRKDFAFLEGGRTLVVHLNQGWTCPPPATPGVHVCAPVTSSTYSGPIGSSSSVGWTISVLAAGKGASGIVNHLEVWVDGVKTVSSAGPKVNTTIPLSNGNHTLFVLEVDSKGASVKSPATTVTIAGSQWQ